MSTGSEIPYRSASRLALWLAIVHILFIVITAHAAFATAGQIEILDAARFGRSISVDRAEERDQLQRIFAGVQVGLMLLAVLLFLTWVYRANRNVRALGAVGLRYTPAWSVGFFFIPIAHLFVPYLVLKELWQASSAQSGTTWRSTPVSPVLGAWWAVELLTGMVQYTPLPVLLGNRGLTEVAQAQLVRTIPPSDYARWPADSLWQDSWGRLSWHIMAMTSFILTVVIVLIITHFQERKQETLVEGRDSGTLSAASLPHDN